MYHPAAPETVRLKDYLDLSLFTVLSRTDVPEPPGGLILWASMNRRRIVNLDSGPFVTAGIVMNKGTILAGFLHFRPPNKASGLLLGLILDSTALFSVFKLSTKGATTKITSCAGRKKQSAFFEHFIKKRLQKNSISPYFY